jgi:acyl-CoA thioester hydrolase
MMPRSAYPRFLAIPTRWRDNDVYGHVNNVVYYSFFDTAVNTHLIAEGGLDIHASPVIGVVVETTCRYHKELTFPEVVDAGLRVERLGKTSVVYDLALFRQGDDEPAATGRFVHVYIDRASRRPAPIPEAIRAALEPLAAPDPGG